MSRAGENAIEEQEKEIDEQGQQRIYGLLKVILFNAYYKELDERF